MFFFKLFDKIDKIFTIYIYIDIDGIKYDMMVFAHNSVSLRCKNIYICFQEKAPFYCATYENAGKYCPYLFIYFLHKACQS